MGAIGALVAATVLLTTVAGGGRLTAMSAVPSTPLTLPTPSYTQAILGLGRALEVNGAGMDGWEFAPADPDLPKPKYDGEDLCRCQLVAETGSVGGAATAVRDRSVSSWAKQAGQAVWGTGPARAHRTSSEPEPAVRLHYRRAGNTGAGA